MPERFVLASYNIHGAVGVDGRYDPERVSRVIAALDADAVVLQEVDSRRHGGGQRQLRFLARTTGLSAIPGPTIVAGNGEYGNAVLTRLEVRRVRRLDLSEPRREPRGALDLTLSRGEATARVVGTHLGLGWRERRRQAERLVEEMERFPRCTVVILGDFNEWLPLRAAVRLLRRECGRVPAPPTFPSRLPLVALDRAWVAPRQKLVEVQVVRTAESRVASDHLPLRVIAEG
jgi:endonuclease/exonuclease/phosphatase family metal-dependent hydrolase